MPLGALIFAGVQLVAVIGRGALGIKRLTDASSEASEISAFVVNTSHKDYDVTWYEPNHGKWVEIPDLLLTGIDTTVKNIEDTARKALGGQANQQEVDQWVRDHFKKEHNQNLDQNKDLQDNFLEFRGEGSGGGTELAVILTEKNDALARIVLLIRKRPGGDYGAGISMSRGSWFQQNGHSLADDKDGSKISDHIQHVSTKVCQFSSGSRTGPEVITRLNGVKVTTNAEQVAFFQIESDTQV